MYIEPIPIRTFVLQAFEYKEIKTITDQWRVETSQIASIATMHIMELGIYKVQPEMEDYMRAVILKFVLNSPEIIRLVDEAEKRERILARTKKSLSD